MEIKARVEPIPVGCVAPSPPWLVAAFAGVDAAEGLVARPVAVYQLPAPPIEPPDIKIAYKVAKLSGGAGSFAYALAADVSEDEARAALERFAAAVPFPEGGSLSACIYADEAKRAADEELACLYSSAEGVSVNGPDDPVDW